MTRILYGVSGEGSGHSSRARDVATQLVAAGHDVLLASYDRGYRNLSADFEVFEIEGLSIGTEDNRVSIARTIRDNVRRLPEGWRRSQALRRHLREWRPDVVLTDFEPVTAYLALGFGLPLVSIDNQHRMRYMRFPRPREMARDARITETVIRMMVPRPDLAFVTTFWFGEVRNDKTRLFPPILRREVREATPTRGEHVLVYVTKAFPSLLDSLRAQRGIPFRVYGFDREGEEGDLSFRPFSREGFLRDLAGASAVIATAGFTLLTEALHLRKPTLALPMRGQFEQELNALLLADMGLGARAREATPGAVSAFLDERASYQRALDTHESGDPTEIHRAVLDLCRDDAALARAAHARRARA